MSRVRTHFWMLVARDHGAGCSPRKYGLNGTMPALTSSSVGSSAISDADGTTVWPLLSKCPRKRLAISSDRIVEPEPFAQLLLPLGHPLADVLAELPDRVAEAAERTRDRLVRANPLGGLGQLPDDQDPRRRAERDVEQPARHAFFAAFFSALISA